MELKKVKCVRTRITPPLLVGGSAIALERLRIRAVKHYYINDGSQSITVPKGGLEPSTGFRTTPPQDGDPYDMAHPGCFSKIAPTSEGVL